jgi:hypothetical protein
LGGSVVTTDRRFSVRHHVREDEANGDEEDWTLIIRDARVTDSGIYECQINTEPKRSKFLDLNVVGEEEDCVQRPFVLEDSLIWAVEMWDSLLSWKRILPSSIWRFKEPRYIKGFSLLDSSFFLRQGKDRE